MFVLSLYTVTHKFTLSLLAHKGKCKGDCGERNYLCISTEGGRETLCRLVNVKGKCYSNYPVEIVAIRMLQWVNPTIIKAWEPQRRKRCKYAV